MRAPIEDGVVYSPFPSTDIPKGSFYEAVKQALLVNPSKTALADEFGSITQAEFLARLQRYALGFQQNGVRPGDRICVHVSNSVENFIALWGCAVAGATVVLAKPSLTERELIYQISDSDSTHLLVEPALAEKALRAAAKLTLKSLFATGPVDGFVSTASFLELDEASFKEVRIADPSEAVLGVVYTSGTTGLPKGVEITHGGFLANIGMSRWTYCWDESDVLLVPTPITHGSGWLCITMSVLLGTTCIIVPPNCNLDIVARAVDHYKIVDRVTRQRLGPHQTGEICFRTPTMMRGYYKRPKETAEFFDEEGWGRSGDAGYYDEDGRIHFVQRFKEMLKCMDNQVVPAELEELLFRQHAEDIADACVVGIPSTEYGEAPAAAVVLRQGAERDDINEVAKKIKSTIAESCSFHKHLHGGVFFLDSLPKTESGKTNRAAVLQLCMEQAAH